jgi:AcrR family transcriptional regulator
MTRTTHTRISAVERRAQIITATRKVALARGLHDLRVADVAAELAVSTGLIHYHFATKHELLEAMLRDTAAEELSAVMLAIAALEHPTAQLEYMIDAYLPSPRRDQSWALWIDVWGEALRDAEIRRISEELDDGWVDVFAQVIAAGVESGAFLSEDPVAAAWRLCSLLDGLGLQVVLHSRTMSRAQMGAHVRRAAELELGYQLVGNARG